MTFEVMQRRLMFGQLGLYVGLAVVVLLLGLPRQIGEGGGLLIEWARVGLFLLGFVVLSVPFDFAGGVWIWRKFGRIPPATISRYTRSLVLHTGIQLLVALLILIAGQANCLSAVLTVVIVGCAIQIQWQAEIAELVGGCQRTERDLGAETRLLRRHNLAIDNVRVLEADDPAFSGGYSGRPGHAVLILPSGWLDESGSPFTARQMIRRAGVLHNGSRNRGLVAGVLSNIIGFTLCAWVPGAGFLTASGLITVMLAMTVWTAVLQLTVLPWLSRRGVLEADYFVAKKGLPKRQLAQLFEISETRCSAETRYPYPMPPKQLRLEQLASHGPPTGAWQAQQMNLYLSWSCLGLLSRALWQIGRPQLWVMGAGD